MKERDAPRHAPELQGEKDFLISRLRRTNHVLTAQVDADFHDRASFHRA